ncbi:MAG: hypothetical protein HOV80_28815 [Polyangiaceae bacterium]|nr:hypothetical protein [Polyangiaceae bacterium]
MTKALLGSARCALLGALLFGSALAGCGGDKPAKAAAPVATSDAEPVANEPAPADPDIDREIPAAAPTATASAVAEPGPEVVPGYPVENVTKTLKTAKERFEICAELERFPSPGVVRFDIDEKGNVIEAGWRRGDAEVKPDARQKCSLMVLRSLQFPAPPKAKLTITYPLVEDGL